MQFSVNALEISECNLLLQDHLVERGDEVGIQETTVEDTKTQASANELEVVQVLRIDS